MPAVLHAAVLTHRGRLGKAAAAPSKWGAERLQGGVLGDDLRGLAQEGRGDCQAQMAGGLEVDD
jgi:hypothetical protein